MKNVKRITNLGNITLTEMTISWKKGDFYNIGMTTADYMNDYIGLGVLPPVSVFNKIQILEGKYKYFAVDHLAEIEISSPKLKTWHQIFDDVYELWFDQCMENKGKFSQEHMDMFLEFVEDIEEARFIKKNKDTEVLIEDIPDFEGYMSEKFYQKFPDFDDSNFSVWLPGTESSRRINVRLEDEADELIKEHLDMNRMLIEKEWYAELEYLDNRSTEEEERTSGYMELKEKLDKIAKKETELLAEYMAIVEAKLPEGLAKQYICWLTPKVKEQHELELKLRMDNPVDIFKETFGNIMSYLNTGYSTVKGFNQLIGNMVVHDKNIDTIVWMREGLVGYAAKKNLQKIRGKKAIIKGSTKTTQSGPYYLQGSILERINKARTKKALDNIQAHLIIMAKWKEYKSNPKGAPLCVPYSKGLEVFKLGINLGLLQNIISKKLKFLNH